jgi:hypothetical protein
MWGETSSRRAPPTAEETDQDDGGSRKGLAAGRRRKTRRVVPARRKGRGHKGSTVEKTEGPGMQELNKGPKRKMAATSEKDRTSGRIFRKTAELKIEKRIVGSSTWLRKVSEWTWWRGRPPPKLKKRRHKHNLRKRGEGGTPVGYSGRAALRREQCGIFAQSKNFGVSRAGRS